MSECLGTRLLSEVCLRLAVADLCSFASISKHWLSVLYGDSVWSHVLQQQYDPASTKQSSAKAACFHLALLENKLLRCGPQHVLAWAVAADLSAVLNRFSMNSDIAEIRFSSLALRPHRPEDETSADDFSRFSAIETGVGQGQYNLLHIAGAHCSRDKIIHQLLRLSCSANLCTAGGWSPLHAACKTGSNSAAVKFLLEANAAVNARAECTVGTCTPLLDACFGTCGDDASVVKTLIDFRADVDECWGMGESALCTAIEHDRPIIGAALVAAGSRCSNLVGSPAAHWDLVNMALSNSHSPHLWLKIFLDASNSRRVDRSPTDMFRIMAMRRDTMTKNASLEICLLLEASMSENERRSILDELLPEVVRNGNFNFLEALLERRILDKLVATFPQLCDLARETLSEREAKLRDVGPATRNLTQRQRDGLQGLMQNFEQDMSRFRAIVEILSANCHPPLGQPPVAQLPLAQELAQVGMSTLRLVICSLPNLDLAYLNVVFLSNVDLEQLWPEVERREHQIHVSINGTLFLARSHEGVEHGKISVGRLHREYLSIEVNSSVSVQHIVFKYSHDVLRCTLEIGTLSQRQTSHSLICIDESAVRENMKRLRGTIIEVERPLAVQMDDGVQLRLLPVDITLVSQSSSEAGLRNSFGMFCADTELTFRKLTSNQFQR